MTIARKLWRCDLCGLAIPLGTEYYYRRLTPWDHPENERYSDYRAHIECNEFWSSGWGLDHDWEFPYGYESDFLAAMREAEVAP